MKTTRLPLVLTSLVLFFSACSFGQQPPADRYPAAARLVAETLADSHYVVPKMDLTFQRNFFKLFLNRLDPEHKFLTREDVEALRVWETRLVDELQNGRTAFPDQVHELLMKRIEESRNLSTEILAKPFDWNATETLETDPEKRDWAPDLESRKKLWVLLLKQRVLTRLVPAMNNTNETNGAAKKFEDLEQDARKAVEKAVLKSLDRSLKDKTEDRRTAFIDAYCKMHDPHSDYMTPDDYTGFKIDMSGTLEGIGAQLSEEDGYVKVSAIIPGSPSFRGKELQPGDVILKVAQGSSEPVDIVGWRVSDAVTLIRGPKGSEVRLTVKKPDGQIKIIAIIREVIILDETYAKSAVYTLPEGGGTWGYINLPKFYADQEVQRRSSSGDVKRELMRLQALGVQGIVLDLRNNGGGYLDDAVNMSGLFFPQGPVVQVRSRQGRGPTLYDRNPATEYDGPLVVMVNAFSASASEIVAAALQDYNRAVIVGGDHTFGKGTVQSIMPLGNDLRQSRRSGSSLGEIKITTQKFYRINGGTTQYRGVVPDLLLPDPFAHLDITERSMQYSLPDDNWEKLPYVKWNPAYDKAALAKESARRMAADPVFAKVGAYIKFLEGQKKNSTQTLQLSAARAEQAKSAEENRLFRDLKPSPVPVVTAVDKYDDLETELRTKKEASQKDWVNQLANDIFLAEAMRILRDMAQAK